MKRKKDYQITEFCHRFLSDYIEEGSCCIDAHLREREKTLNFSAIRQGRVEKCTRLIYRFRLWNERRRGKAGKCRYRERAVLYCEGHEHMAEYVKEKADVVMFNFGYLPGGDHSVATRPETSLRAVSEAMGLLKEGGVISLCIYSGGGYRIRGERRSFGLPERTGSEEVARDRVQLL